MSAARGPDPSASSASTGDAGATGPSFFEEQRAGLCREIAASLENVLQNINRLNRSLEGVIAVGNEFSSVEALWSQFENVMAHGQGLGEQKEAENGEDEEGEAEDEEDAEREDGRPRSRGRA